MDDPGGLLGIGSGWAIVAYGVLAILRGQLVPRRTHDDKVREVEYLRDALKVSEEARRAAQQQAAELTELARTGVHALSALPHGEVTDRVPDRTTAAPPQG